MFYHKKTLLKDKEEYGQNIPFVSSCHKFISLQKEPFLGECSFEFRPEYNLETWIPAGWLRLFNYYVRNIKFNIEL